MAEGAQKIDKSEYSVLCLGCGHMASAMLRGWRAQNLPISIHIIDPKPLAADLQVDHHSTSLDILDSGAVFDVVLLAVPPQIADIAMTGLAEYLHPKTLVVSIMAGKTLAYLGAKLANHPTLVRVMPNMPAQIGQGICGYIAANGLDTTQQHRFESLIKASGKAIALKTESEINIVTALSGSGPAYTFLLIKAMTDAGISLGLDTEQAETLALHTVAGSGQFALQAEGSAQELLDKIAVSGGTTEAALNVLNANDGFGSLLKTAIHKAYNRAEELG